MERAIQPSLGPRLTWRGAKPHPAPCHPSVAWPRPARAAPAPPASSSALPSLRNSPPLSLIARGLVLAAAQQRQSTPADAAFNVSVNVNTKGSPASSDTDALDAMDNSSLTSMDWPEWIAATSSSDSDGGVLLPDAAERSTLQGESSSNGGVTTQESRTTVAGAVTLPDGEVLTGAVVASSTTTTVSEPTANGQASHGRDVVSWTGPQGGPQQQVSTTTIRMAFYAVAASFDRRQLETQLKTTYGSSNVHKYPDVIHVQTAPGKNGGPGSDVFFFDFGVVACWALTQEQEREVVRNLAVQCAVQPLPEKDHETDVFRCTYTSNPEYAVRRANGPNGQPTGHGQPAGHSATANSQPAPAPTATSTNGLATAMAAMAALTTAPPGAPTAAAVAPLSVDFDDESLAIGLVGRRVTRRGERGVVTSAPPSAGVAGAGVLAGGAGGRAAAEATAESSAPGAGPFSPSLLPFPPRISDDTVMLHVRHIGDIATQLAVSYGLAQSTKMCVFEKATAALGAETESLPVLLAENGKVHLSDTEIGKLLGRVFVLKRSVNLLGSVLGTPEFFWYAPDQLQALYSRITEYVELSTRAQLLNGRFEVLQELLELLRAQEENRHGTRLELVVIWLIVVEVVLGVFELLEMFGVIGIPHGGMH
ncbi:hypothetical protein HYH03_017028 [Edaphochlamys debaryana]|uniref:DUF155 domain-containing protein n=1 Tax=Edaphochlamys debaryana TaxID=47281 RepID=A0A835XKX9_9CHLO|nr:hypothetical protein HYH03_017028 [Edaphochlamys debaryana]|eukprot:KAG2484146.1 hypothetical protein HYH03_017028 [Edaphochlamys debaryana]